MRYEQLAVRNLVRRRTRTVLTVAGVAIAVALLFTLLAFNVGYERELNREVGSLGFHMLAVPKGCPYEAASLIIHGGVIPKYLDDRDLAQVRATPGVSSATPLLLHQFVKNGTPHIVYGMDPEGIAAIKPWWTIEGRYYTDGEQRVMVVGRDLAEKEHLTIGSVIPFGKDREPFIVVGILERTGSQDDGFHFVPLAEAQRVFEKEGKVTAIALRIDDLSHSMAIAGSLEKIPDLQVITMAQVTGTILSLIRSARTLLYSVMALAVIISGSGIANTLLMSISERMREFGMLKAIGASGMDIARLVLTETLIITTAGGLIGVIGAAIAGPLVESFVRSSLPYAPAGTLITPDPVIAAGCILFSVLLGLVCGIYPAWKAARQLPMEAIRGGYE
jgi:putative ABC transport system permease protein